MKKNLVVALIFLFFTGCAGSSGVTKNFKVIADPPDSVIKVVSSTEQKEQRYSSPAAITVELPQDPALTARVVLEVNKDKYKPFTMAIRHINDGDTIRVKLEEILTYRLKYRLLMPVKSDETKFQDGTISIAFTVSEQAFQVSLTNLTAHPLKLLWEQTQYTDIFGRNHRLMHSGVRNQNRNNPIPDQVIQPRSSIQATVTPVDNVSMSQQTKDYEIKPLFPREAGVALKGKTFNLFIPMEINRSITPYNFKMEITEAAKEAPKK